MFRRHAFLAAAGAAALLTTACATSPAAGPSAPMTPGAAPSVASPATPAAGTMTVANMASSTFWLAEEKLIPDDPVLALVNTGSRDTDAPMGVTIACKAANGTMSVHLGRQATTRVGQTATYKLRAGPVARDIEGQFMASKGSPDADFVFKVSSADLMALGQIDMVAFISDQGEAQWALVKDPAAKVQAKYVGSLKNFATAARDFVSFCNPK